MKKILLIIIFMSLMIGVLPQITIPQNKDEINYQMDFDDEDIPELINI